MSKDELTQGLYEVLITSGLEGRLSALPSDRLTPDVSSLANAESGDRVARHVAGLLERVVNDLPERDRAQGAVHLASQLLTYLAGMQEVDQSILAGELLVEPGVVLRSILGRLPDGSAERIDRPLTPLLDTTVFTNAPGEPAVAHEIRAEIASADSIDVLMAFIRFSGIRSLLDPLRRHCEKGRPLRILTTTYTNSTEQRALEELVGAGAEVHVSYDTSMTRLHAKAWLFHRHSGFSTTYVGSSNLTHSAQVTGLEWNVRLSEARNRDAVAKMTAVFESYWASQDFIPYDRDEFGEKTRGGETGPTLMLSPLQIVLRPFQEVLLERLALARQQGHHRNLLVSATGTGKTVMAAVDYLRLRETLPRARLLFVAHREEILDQSRATFAHAVGDIAFGEKWVGRHRPRVFDHVFASIQSLNASGVDSIDPSHFDVVIVDEFHHAAARSYETLLGHLKPLELLGLTATPERADGLNVLAHFGDRIAAELRLWDAIDQQFLVPFNYFGVADSADFRNVPWQRAGGYQSQGLTNALTQRQVSNLVLEQVRRRVADPHSMRALGFCVSVEHAKYMAARFQEAGLDAKAIWGDSPEQERRQALSDLAAGRIQVLFSVDLFNEGVDVPAVDTLLLLRPTESATLFLQQLGRGLRRIPSKTTCTVLDFVGLHRSEFRYDRRFRALLGGSRKDLEDQINRGFPFMPAGCSLDLDPVARDRVLASVRDALPTRWPERWQELRALGDISLVSYLHESGLELEDIYAGSHSWTEMRAAAGFDHSTAGPNEVELLRAVGRLAHVDDDERIDAYKRLAADFRTLAPERISARDKSYLRMLVGSLTSLRGQSTLEQAVQQLADNPRVGDELAAVLDALPDRIEHVSFPGTDNLPLRLHARYSRLEILAAFGVGPGVRPPSWQSGVWALPAANTDLFAFTLDKSIGGFSPTTRYRDYAISRDLIHWQSQSRTSAASATGQRYIHHEARGSSIRLFARLRADDRAFWHLGTAAYDGHQGDRPISFTWKLDHPLPADLYTAFAAAVA